MIITAVYVSLIVTGFPLNIVTILPFVKRCFPLKTSDLPVLSITIANCILIAFAMPIAAVQNASGTWVLGFNGCIWYAFFNTVVGLGSMLHHVVLAVERCFNTHNPMANDVSQKKICSIIGIVWGFAVLWGVFPLIGWSSYAPEGTGNTYTCSIKWRVDDSAEASYIVCLVVVFFLLPIVVIITSYTIMYQDLQKMTARSKQLCGRGARETIEVLMAKKRVVLTAFILMLVFCICWTPYTVVSLYSAFSETDSMTPLVSTISSISAKSSVLLNPVVYFLRYKKFRKAIKKLFGFNRNPFSS